MGNKQNQNSRPLWRDLPGLANLAQLVVKLLHWAQQQCAGWAQHRHEWWHDVLAVVRDWW